MLKFLQNSDEVVELLHSLAICPELESFKVGFAGSYANGVNKKASAIDIVLKLKEDNDKSKIGSLDLNYFISQFMESAYSNKYRILWLDLLEDDEIKVVDFMRSIGVEANPESVYTNIVGEVQWIDAVDTEKSDIISSSVMTWDEDEDFADLDEESDS